MMRCTRCGEDVPDSVGMAHFMNCDGTPSVTISSDGKAAVDPSYFWKPCGRNTPRGVKLQLINKAAGVAVYGMWSPGCGFTHWAPLPKFPPGD